MFDLSGGMLLNLLLTDVLLVVALFSDLPCVFYVEMTSGSTVMSIFCLTFSLGISKIVGTP